MFNVSSILGGLPQYRYKIIHAIMMQSLEDHFNEFQAQENISIEDVQITSSKERFVLLIKYRELPLDDSEEAE